MNTAYFDLRAADSLVDPVGSGTGAYDYTFEIPLLPAYAIEYFVFDLGLFSLYESPDVRIEGNRLHVRFPEPLSETERFRLFVHYHGIKDYALLFPGVREPSLRVRLGQFYQEAEFAFASAPWLSFSLMCGAIFEGMLHDKIGGRRPTFDALIGSAFDRGLVDAGTRDVMHTVREHRNQIHASRHGEPYVSRMNAMETRTVLDKLVAAG